MIIRLIAGAVGILGVAGITLYHWNKAEAYEPEQSVVHGAVISVAEQDHTCKTVIIYCGDPENPRWSHRVDSDERNLKFKQKVTTEVVEFSIEGGEFGEGTLTLPLPALGMCGMQCL